MHCVSLCLPSFTLEIVARCLVSNTHTVPSSKHAITTVSVEGAIPVSLYTREEREVASMGAPVHEAAGRAYRVRVHGEVGRPRRWRFRGG